MNMIFEALFSFMRYVFVELLWRGLGQLAWTGISRLFKGGWVLISEFFNTFNRDSQRKNSKSDIDN